MSKDSLTVLFAEDNPDNRIPVACDLRNEGFDVVEVFNPKQAMMALAEMDFDLVILDLVMPESNPHGGEQVLKFMKGEKIRTPVILATAWGYNGPALRATDVYPAVVKSILTKSFSSEELLEAINAALAQPVTN